MKKILENEAELGHNGIIEHTNCEECMEDYMFLMKDNYHEFEIGLKTILGCLSFAEKEGAIPKLPYEWWNLVKNSYPETRHTP